jgi:hypothetical protein
MREDASGLQRVDHVTAQASQRVTDWRYPATKAACLSVDGRYCGWRKRMHAGFDDGP